MKLLNILVFLLIFNTLIFLGYLASTLSGKSIYETSIEYTNITRIIDGDTFETELGKVRMLGINTPEKKEAGFEEAKNFLFQFQDKEIKLIKTIEDKDKYGRLLRYVFYQDLFLNEEILENGLAHFYSYNEDKYTRRLEKAEEKSRNLGLGLWQKSQLICSNCIILKELNSKDPGEYIILKNKCSFSCNLSGWIIKDDASHKTKLNFSIPAFEQEKIDYKGRVWNDAGDSFYLRDDSGLLVVFYRY